MASLPRMRNVCYNAHASCAAEIPLKRGYAEKYIIFAMAIRRPTPLNVNAGTHSGNQTQYPFSNAVPLLGAGTRPYFNPDSPGLQEHRGWTATSSELEESDDEGICAQGEISGKVAIAERMNRF